MQNNIIEKIKNKIDITFRLLPTKRESKTNELLFLGLRFYEII